MIETIKNSDIAELLGITKPEDQIEQQSIMSEVITSFALYRLIESVDSENKQLIENLNVDQIIEQFPQFLDFIEQESYSYKKGSLEAQLNDWESEISNLGNRMKVPELIQNLLDSIKKLRDIINSDDSANFDIVFQKYNHIKSQITQLQNE